MKKFDIAIIFIVMIIGIGIYYAYFSIYQIKADDILYVEIVYENDVLHKIKLEENTNEKYIINKGNHHNVVVITYNEIKMIEADCPDKYCLRMFMNYRNYTPIICTNGVVVRIVGETYGDYDILVP